VLCFPFFVIFIFNEESLIMKGILLKKWFQSNWLKLWYSVAYQNDTDQKSSSTTIKMDRFCCSAISKLLF